MESEQIINMYTKLESELAIKQLQIMKINQELVIVNNTTNFIIKEMTKFKTTFNKLCADYDNLKHQFAIFQGNLKSQELLFTSRLFSSDERFRINDIQMAMMRNEIELLKQSRYIIVSR